MNYVIPATAVRNRTVVHSGSQMDARSLGAAFYFSRLPESPDCLGSLWRQGCCSQSPRLREGGGDKDMLLCQVYCCPGRGPILAHRRPRPTIPAPPGSWGYHGVQLSFSLPWHLAQGLDSYRGNIEGVCVWGCFIWEKRHRGHLIQAEARAPEEEGSSPDLQFSNLDAGYLGTHLSWKGQWLHKDPFL